MRILGFSKKWDKLNNGIMFTTFRFPRKDKDWEVEETVQIVYKPRSKNREPLGVARIIRKDTKDLSKEWSYYPRSHRPNTPDMLTPDEAKEDGFTGMHGGGDREKMIKYLTKSQHTHKNRENLINKLTLYWIDKVIK